MEIIIEICWVIFSLIFKEDVAAAILTACSIPMFKLFMKTPDQNVKDVTLYLTELVENVPQIRKETVETLCNLLVKTPILQNKNMIAAKIKELPLDANPDAVKSAFIEVYLHVSPKYGLTLAEFLPKLAEHTKFTQDDLLKLVGKRNMQNEYNTYLAIQLLPYVSDSVERLCNFCIASEYFCAPLLVALIGRVTKTSQISKQLFARLMRDQNVLTEQQMN